MWITKKNLVLGYGQTLRSRKMRLTRIAVRSVAIVAFAIVILRATTAIVTCVYIRRCNRALPAHQVAFTNDLDHFNQVSGNVNYRFAYPVQQHPVAQLRVPQCFRNFLAWRYPVENAEKFTVAFMGDLCSANGMRYFVIVEVEETGSLHAYSLSLPVANQIFSRRRGLREEAVHSSGRTTGISTTVYVGEVDRDDPSRVLIAVEFSGRRLRWAGTVGDDGTVRFVLVDEYEKIRDLRDDEEL